MQKLRNQEKTKRKFIPSDLEIRSWNDIISFHGLLLNADLNSADELEEWLTRFIHGKAK